MTPARLCHAFDTLYTDMWGHKRKELVQLCDKLHGHGLFYGGVRQVKPEDRATFTTDYTF